MVKSHPIDQISSVNDVRSLLMDTVGSNHPEIGLLQAVRLNSKYHLLGLRDFSFLEWAFFCISTFTCGKNASDNLAQMSVISMWNLNVKTSPPRLAKKECCYSLQATLLQACCVILIFLMISVVSMASLMIYLSQCTHAMTSGMTWGHIMVSPADIITLSVISGCKAAKTGDKVLIVERCAISERW